MGAGYSYLHKAAPLGQDNAVVVAGTRRATPSGAGHFGYLFLLNQKTYFYSPA
jgi:hypothetical protein